MYKLSQKAADDFGEIYEYTYLNFGEDQADKYTEEMELCLTILDKIPLIGRDYSEIGQGIRWHEYQKHSIFYRISNNGILVVRVLHQQMNPMLRMPSRET